MSEPSLTIDPALLTEFIDESLDMLASVDSLFVQLEQAPDNLDIIQAIFRPVHSIKGNSAFFGFTKVKTLAHESESLLDMLRKKTLAVSETLISVLLKSVDELKAMLDRARLSGPEVVDQAAYEALVEEVRNAATTKVVEADDLWCDAFSRLEALRKALAPDAAQLITELDAAMMCLRKLHPGVQLETGNANIAAEGLPEPMALIMKKIGEPFGDSLPVEESEAVGAALRQLPGLVAGNELAQAILADMLDSYQVFVDSVGFDSLLRELLLEKARELIAIQPWPVVKKELEPAPAQAEEPSKPKPEAAAQHPVETTAKTMRVSEAHIDKFLSFVGELVVVGDMFSHLERQLANKLHDSYLVNDFRRINETFTVLSHDLQRSIMSIRKVAVGTLLSRAPRIIRDVATVAGKEIAATVEGGHIEVDKSLIDILDAPLTHMVRNAADHGIEMPEARQQHGKPREGHIQIIAEESSTNITLIVRDDGAGINLEALKKKAESMGLVRADQPLSENDIVNLLFSSGVSTAQKVTDVSGRGVGMDVVMRMVDQAGGQISVSTKAGEGSVFQVQLPKSVTTQIMDGFVVIVDNQCYVLAMNRIRETVKIEHNDITVITGRGRCIQRHGMILPVLDMREELGLPHRDMESAYELMVTAEAQRRQFALVVDGVRGVQQIVVRTLEGMSSGAESITGGALLGDGSVALIIDVDKLSPLLA